MWPPMDSKMADNPTQDVILTAREVAKLLRVSVTHVTICAGRGTIPARKMGRRWLFSREKLIRWVEEGESNGRKTKT